MLAVNQYLCTYAEIKRDMRFCKRLYHRHINATGQALLKFLPIVSPFYADVHKYSLTASIICIPQCYRHKHVVADSASLRASVLSSVFPPYFCHSHTVE